MREISRNAPTYLTIGEDGHGQRLDNYLLKLLKGVPKTHVYRIVRTGEVRVNKLRADAADRLASGDVLRIPPVRVSAAPAGRVGTAAGTDIEAAILHEDDDFIALNKPAALAVHGGSGVSLGVIELLRKSRPQARFLELVHRLDRDTSGLLLVAKRRSALLALQSALRSGAMAKHYLALLAGRWRGGARDVSLALTKTVTASGERRVYADERGKTAQTHFTPLERFADCTLVDALLLTGRTHQIRVHAKSVGHSVVGDDKYGDAGVNARTKGEGFKRMFLHAHRLSFAHPSTGRPVELEAPLDTACERYLATLRGTVEHAAAL